MHSSIPLLIVSVEGEAWQGEGGGFSLCLPRFDLKKLNEIRLGLGCKPGLG